MALFVMILRKMIKNKWLELSLLLGLVLSVALTSSMPIYTNAILQRLLLKDLQNMQVESQQYPGVHWSSAYLPSQADLTATVPPGQTAPTTPPPPTEQKDGSFQTTDAFLKKNAENEFGLPLQYFVRERATDKYQFVPTDPDKVDATKQRIADFTGISDMEDHIKLVDGRMPEKDEPVNGVYEVLVVPDALTNMSLVLGNEFQIQDDSVTEPIKVKPVGVIDRKDYNDVFWYNYLSSYSNSFLLNFDIFERDFTAGKKLDVTASYWYFALDYSKITLNTVTDFVITSNVIENYLANHFDNYSTKAPALQTLGQYFEKEAKLRVMLWSLNVPVMLMLGFYLYMVSNLITERQKTEIAVLRSRGASRWQILLGYTIEGIVLGTVAFLIGPYFGELLTKVLGASNGFLEFVQRAKLDVNLNREAFQYALIAVGSSVLMTLIPALLATKVSIVGHKQALARMQKMSFWHKFGVDVVLVGIALYGLYNFRNRLKDMVTLGLSSTDLKVDPLLFLVPALFILGAGLIILRIYPWFVRALYWIGRRFWPPSLYSTLIQVGRSTTQYQFIMVFLIITVATGLFSASAARTINRNAADKISYSIGSDIALKIKWENNAPPPVSEDDDSGDDSGDGDSSSSTTTTPTIPTAPVKTQYSEPPFLPFTELPGVEHAAKVFTKDVANFTMGKEKDVVKLMGIDTDDFGMTTWYRDQLLDHHINEYLNLLAANPSAVLISRSLADAHNVKEGDHILVNWQGVDNAEFVVYGIVDYWPTWNPNPGPDDKVTVKTKTGSTTQIKYPMLIVGQLPYIQNNLALEPYDVWLKLKPDGTSAEVYKAIEDQNLPVLSLEDSRQELIKAKNDPFQLAINGVMTLGFLISIVISFFGFLLYWILSLTARTLQFGILRAMGVSFIQLIVMIVVEQILTSGAAIGIGMVIGNATSELFVPMFQMSFDPSSQVPPFKVTFDPRDQQELYLIVTAMITFGLCILGYMLSRIKIHQAVKLGED